MQPGQTRFAATMALLRGMVMLIAGIFALISPTTALTVIVIVGGFTIYWFYLFLATLQADPDYALMRDAAMAAGSTVAFALGLGGLACVDRFLFDADDHPRV